VIRHTLTFRLVHPSGSPAEREFLDAAQALAAIPGVQRFEQWRQTSTRNDFTFGLSMEFVDQEAYDAYDRHPVHRAFVAQRWVPEVDDFLELDYQPLG
jgi:heme-degrading monooxygenase HmoA